MKVECSKCFLDTEVKIVEEKWQGNEKCSFYCQRCGEEYVISIMNENILARIELLDKLQKGYLKLYDLNKDKGHLTNRMAVVLERIKDLRRMNREEGKILAERYQRRG